MSNYASRYIHARPAVGTAAAVAQGFRREPARLGGTALSEPLTNELLSALPGEEFERLRGQLEPVTLRAGEEIYRYGEPVQFAYFPASGVVSQLHVLADG